jgi:RNA polymerase sigma factor (TIGR02999 family)
MQPRMPSQLDLTRLLQQWRGGDRDNEAQLFEQIYPVLRVIAVQRLREGQALTMQATEIANECFIRLIDSPSAILSREQFFAMASTVIRRVIIDHFRERHAQKRGGNAPKVSIQALPDTEQPQEAYSEADWIRLDQILSALARVDPEGARVVELRYFMGMNLQQAAESLNVSVSTVQRQWRTARAWLHSRMLES